MPKDTVDLDELIHKMTRDLIEDTARIQSRSIWFPMLLGAAFTLIMITFWIGLTHLIEAGI